ncbi:MAG: UDP-N-acetylmuramate dehydrogenase [Polyangiaceae bacterium]
MREDRNVSLASFTTLRLGGAALRFVRVESVAELEEVVSEADRRAEPLLVLGGGSNLVVGDEGVGLAVQIAFDGVEVVKEGDRVRVTVAAGASWDDFVARAVSEGWSGVECLSGIPGLVGATPMQNVGAYGQDVGETIVRVGVFDRASRSRAWLDREACAFTYRNSYFKGKERYVITHVEFSFAVDPLGAPIRYAELSRALGIAEGERAPASVIRPMVIDLRRKKGMVIDAADPDSVSAGSFFMNPIVSADALRRIEESITEPVPRFDMAGEYKVPAAWLIERAGFAKGHAAGHVGISKKHALALVHRGGGTTTELLSLARAIRDGVRARFGVELVPEPVMVGCSL